MVDPCWVWRVNFKRSLHFLHQIRAFDCVKELNGLVSAFTAQRDTKRTCLCCRHAIHIVRRLLNVCQQYCHVILNKIRVRPGLHAWFRPKTEGSAVQTFGDLPVTEVLRLASFGILISVRASNQAIVVQVSLHFKQLDLGGRKPRGKAWIHHKGPAKPLETGGIQGRKIFGFRLFSAF